MRKFVIFFILVCTFSCTQKIVLNKNLAIHKKIAVLPFVVRLNLNKKQQTIISENEKSVLSQNLSLDLQRKFYLLGSKYFEKKKVLINFQNSDETLAILSKNGIRFNDLLNNKLDLTKLLSVDAVLLPTMEITQKGAAFSVPNLLLPLPVAIDVGNLHIDFNLTIKDNSIDSALWKHRYEHWYQAANKVKKDKVELTNNFLEPLYNNVEDIFKDFFIKQPYQKSN